MSDRKPVHTPSQAERYFEQQHETQLPPHPEKKKHKKKTTKQNSGKPR